MSRQSPNIAPPDAIRVRYRVRFSKTDLLRWISHRDLSTLIERVARRVDLPLSMTEGFHQKPRLSFPSALPLGVESLDEVFEIELCEDLPSSEVLQRLQDDRQPGLTIHNVVQLAPREAKARLSATEYQVNVPDDWDESERVIVESSIESLRANPTVQVQRKDRAVTIHSGHHVPELVLHGDHLYLRMVIEEGASLKVTDLLDHLGLSDWLSRGSTIIRTRVELVPTHSSRRT
ncbi:MAG: TIGR03936 family radical SAM-associated protein [Planctomycetota bacterium]